MFRKIISAIRPDRNDYTDSMNIIIEALSTLPKGWSQARDGLRCESGVIGLSDKQFKKGLALGLNRGLIEYGRPMRSIFESYNEMPTYRLKSQ